MQKFNILIYNLVIIFNFSFCLLLVLQFYDSINILTKLTSVYSLKQCAEEIYDQLIDFRHPRGVDVPNEILELGHFNLQAKYGPRRSNNWPAEYCQNVEKIFKFFWVFLNLILFTINSKWFYARTHTRTHTHTHTHTQIYIDVKMRNEEKTSRRIRSIRHQPYTKI